MDIHQCARVITLSLLLLVPCVLFAATPGAGGDFVPIAPIPGANGGFATAGSLGQYINALFKLSLAAGAALAAIYIAIGGFEYIFSEAMESKKDGRIRIMHALFGLLILILVTVILYVIGGNGAINVDIFG